MAVAGLNHAGHGPTLGADDHGQYLLHAKALVEGRPYADIGFIHTPYSTKVAPLTEPPGLPLLIAGVFLVRGQRTQAVRGILYVSFALFAVFVFTYFRSISGAGIAAVVTAWTVTSLARMHVLDTVLADLPFCAALWACFWLADTTPNSRGQRIALLAVAGAAAFLFRLAALPLIPAAFFAAFATRRTGGWRAYAALGVFWSAVALLVM